MCSFMSTYKNCIKFGKSQNMSYHRFPVHITLAPFLFPPFLFQRSISRPLLCWEEANSSILSHTARGERDALVYPYLEHMSVLRWMLAEYRLFSSWQTQSLHTSLCKL